MKIYICDECGQENKYAEKPLFYSQEVPTGWIHINMDGYYNNDSISGNRRAIQRSGEYHFCSKECFISSFFFISTVEKLNIKLNEEINKLKSETKHLNNRINAYKSVISRLNNKKYKL